jgi:hypothetical protein
MTREWQEKAKEYERLAGLGRLEQKLVESSSLPPRTAIALVQALKDKGVVEAEREAERQRRESARLNAEYDADDLADEAERLARMARVNDELFAAWKAEQAAEKKRRETWTPPPPFGQLRP